MASTISVDTIQGSTTAGKVVMPAGHVVQCVQFYQAQTSSTSTTSSSMVATGLKKTITPKFSGSLIIVECHLGMPYTTGWAEVRVFLNGTQMAGGSSYHMGYIDASHNNYSGMTFKGQHTATDNTTALEFEVYCRAGTGTFSYYHNNAHRSVTLWEIAQ